MAKIQELLKDKTDEVDVESILTRNPWIKKRNQKCILSPDSDGLLCGLFLSHYLDWEIIGFYDGKVCVIKDGESCYNDDTAFIDIEIYREGIKSMGHHMLSMYNNTLPDDWEVKFKECIQPNLERGYDKNNFDKDAVFQLAENLINNNISYVVVQGTTGESSTLEINEKKIVNNTYIDAFKNKVPLILGLSSNNTNYLCNEIKVTNLDGFDAIMSVCPYYNKPSQEGLYNHFLKISQATTKPILMYNVPSRTGVNINNETIVNIYKNSDNIIGVKEASGEVNRIKQLKSKLENDFLVISGDDFTMIDAIRNGADGIISVAANVYPKIMVETYNQMISDINNVKTLNDNNFVLNEFINLIFEECNPSGIKYALSKLNLCSSKVRLPLSEISENLKSKIEKFIKKHPPFN